MKNKKYLLSAFSFLIACLMTGADFDRNSLTDDVAECEHNIYSEISDENANTENANIENANNENLNNKTSNDKNANNKVLNNEGESIIKTEIKEYAFFAETKEKALETAAFYSAELVSFNDGIGVLSFESDSDLSQITFNSNSNSNEPPVLYPEYLYTVDYEDGNVNEDEEIQWHLETTKVESVWEITKGKGIKVAVVDTGVNLEHSDLKDSIVVADTSIPESEYEQGGRFDASYMGAEDYFGHGTHVVGIVGARDNGFGCKGIAPECEIISIKSLEKQGNRGIGKTSWVVAGIQKAIENNANVINLSLGGSAVKDEMLLTVIQEATQKGIIVVCAAGNISGTQQIFYPGAYEEVVAVSGLMKAGDSVEFATSYSNYGEWIDISAPGSTIMSTIIGGYGTKTGTSMASPIVAGSIALLMANDSSLTRADILHLLYDSSDDMGDEGKDDKYGYGSLNIENMFKLYKEEYIVPKPVAKIPNGAVVGEGTPIVIDTPDKVQKVVYTIDGTEPSSESQSVPKEGIVFDEYIENVTINTRSIMPSGRMGSVVTFTYSFVKKVVDVTSDTKLDNEVMPQYGTYIDPVLKLPCRRYKVMVEPKNSITISISGEDLSNVDLYLFDKAGEDGKILTQAKSKNGKGSLKWVNKTKESVEVWISVNKKEIVEEDVPLTYSLSAKCEKVKNENKPETEDSNDTDNNSNENKQNNNQENHTSNSSGQNNNQSSQMPQDSSAEETSASEFTYEEDWLYTMTEVAEPQEITNGSDDNQNQNVITGVEATEGISESDKTPEKNNETDNTGDSSLELETVVEETSQSNLSEEDYSYMSNLPDKDNKDSENNRKSGEYSIFIWAFIAFLVTGIIVFALNKGFSSNENDN